MILVSRTCLSSLRPSVWPGPRLGALASRRQGIARDTCKEEKVPTWERKWDSWDGNV